MKSMDQVDDMLMLKFLEGEGSVIATFTIYGVKKKGHVLLGLPADREAAMITLGLYQPQSLIAKVFARGLFLLIFVRLHRLLPRLDLELRGGGPLAVLASSQERMGFLLGNPGAKARRAMVVYHNESGYGVDKIGLDEVSRASVTAETAVIQSLPKKVVGLPILAGINESDDWASYSTKYIRGTSPRKKDDSLVVALLSEWMKGNKGQALKNTRQWSCMAEYAIEHKDLDIWGELCDASLLQVKMGIFHGDFAPWNLKKSDEGEISVLDWENGCNCGPAGWDWLHYLIQRATLVDGLDSTKTLNTCRSWAETDRGEKFLSEAGWGGRVDLWIGTYLVYSNWILGFDRKDLMKAWQLGHILETGYSCTRVSG